MAAGGIRDHLGGGFARYATDSVWLVPHFEKMLYDNAQLALGVPPCLAGDRRRPSRCGRPATRSTSWPATCWSRTRTAWSASPPASMPTRTATRDAPMSGHAAEVDDDPGTGCAVVLRRIRRHARTATGRARRSCPGSVMTTELARTWSMSREEVAAAPGGARDRLLVVRDRRAPSLPATTRCSRPGMGWPWPRSRRPAGSCPMARATRRWPRTSPRPCTSASRGRGWSAATIVEGRPTGPAGGARGPHAPRGRSAGALPDDLRRALDRLGDRSSWTSCIDAFRATRRVASTTPRTTPMACSRVRGASSTAPCRRATRWP